MKHTLYMRVALVALLALGVSACGQKGPLVLPASNTPSAAPADDANAPGAQVPQEEIETEDVEKQH